MPDCSDSIEKQLSCFPFSYVKEAMRIQFLSTLRAKYVIIISCLCILFRINIIIIFLFFQIETKEQLFKN